jgi:signal transduction histidine kinase
MRFQTKLLLVTGVLLALSLSAAALAYWGTERSHYTLERSRLASRQLEALLELSRHVYGASLQSLIALLNGDSERAISLAPPDANTAADLARARQMVIAEVAVVGEREKPAEKRELQRLMQIRADIEALGETLGRAAAGQQKLPASTTLQLAEPLKQIGVDAGFSARIDAAIEDETGEVIEADRAAFAFYDRLATAVKLHALFAALFAAACVVLLLSGLRRPLADLMTGTQMLAAGDLSHRIQLSGRDEFAGLARSFNSMADDLQLQRTQLNDAKDQLEKAVAERTDELRLANQALEHADEVRRRFLADISHELRTPLTIIRGEAQVTLRDKSATASESRQALQRVSEQAGQMSALVDDLLFIARHDANEICLELDEVPIDEVIEKTCSELKLTASAKDISIEWICHDNGLTVMGDAVRLHQVFLILLNNAIAYSNPKDNVIVELSSSGDHVLALVNDEGIGVEAEEVDHVFERYRRGVNAGKYHAEGVGLGLPVARAIVEAHDGKIELKSVLNAGTTVRVTLPKDRHAGGCA